MPILYLDEDIRPDFVDLLIPPDLYARSARGERRLGAGDAFQLIYAAKRNWTLVTCNRKHYHLLHTHGFCGPIGGASVAAIPTSLRGIKGFQRPSSSPRFTASSPMARTSRVRYLTGSYPKTHGGNFFRKIADRDSAILREVDWRKGKYCTLRSSCP